tara:strand:+ start:289 stop:615 length:327 start_codon:yes stop_codon:yes gene_type:complete
MAVHWFPEMDEVLRARLSQGVHMEDIGVEIGVAANTARKRCRELSLPYPRRQPAKPKAPKSKREPLEMKFADLLADGIPPKTAGEMLGLASGNSMMQRIRSKLGWQAV